eukprot:2800003-Rhodomonas_salina.4
MLCYAGLYFYPMLGENEKIIAKAGFKVSHSSSPPSTAFPAQTEPGTWVLGVDSAASLAARALLLLACLPQSPVADMVCWDVTVGGCRGHHAGGQRDCQAVARQPRDVQGGAQGA